SVARRWLSAEQNPRRALAGKYLPRFEWSVDARGGRLCERCDAVSTAPGGSRMADPIITRLLDSRGDPHIRAIFDAIRTPSASGAGIRRLDQHAAADWLEECGASTAASRCHLAAERSGAFAAGEWLRATVAGGVFSGAVPVARLAVEFPLISGAFHVYLSR